MRPIRVAALGLPFRFVVVIVAVAFVFIFPSGVAHCLFVVSFLSEVSNRCCEGARGLSQQVDARILSRTLPLAGSLGFIRVLPPRLLFF